MAKTSARPRVGDVLEIPLGKGGRVGYGQYLLDHRVEPLPKGAMPVPYRVSMGELLGVFPRTYRGSEQPVDLQKIVQNKFLFMTFFSIRYAVQLKMIQVIGHCDIPPAGRQLPHFRIVNSTKPGKPKWAIWDGENTRVPEKLTAKEKKLPLYGLPSFDILQERIRDQWSHENVE